MRTEFKLFLLAFMFIPLLGFGQRFTAGLVGGLSATQVDGDSLGGYHKTGVVAGALSNYKINENLSLQFEMNYIQKGSKTANTPDSTGFAPFFRMRLGYIEVPVTLNYHFSLKSHWIASVGLSAATLMRATEETDYVKLITTNIKRYDFCMNAGIAWRFLPGLYLRYRFAYSIVPIRFNATARNRITGRGQYNNVMEIGLVYYFRNF